MHSTTLRGSSTLMRGSWPSSNRDGAKCLRRDCQNQLGTSLKRVTSERGCQGSHDPRIVQRVVGGKSQDSCFEKVIELSGWASSLKIRTFGRERPAESYQFLEARILGFTVMLALRFFFFVIY